jgi:spore maturation protein CgeB
MKILLLTTGPRYDYNCDINFYAPLKSLFKDVINYDYLLRIQKIGKKATNREIVDIVTSERPEYTFFLTYQDQIRDSTLDAITKLNSKVVAWFSDDHWRFDKYSRFVAKHVFCSITTDKEAYRKYRNLNLNVIRSQWASNPDYYKKQPSTFKYDVSFVGQNYGLRAEFLNFLQNKGVNLKVFGKGFGSVLEFDDLVKLFSESKINLNLSGCSADDRVKQVKGRVFEVPMCGGFLLTEYAEGLEECFHIGEEIECFQGRDEALEKIEYYLKNETERKKIAQAGYIASQERHTWNKRLGDIFKKLDNIKEINKTLSIISKISDKITEIKVRENT